MTSSRWARRPPASRRCSRCPGCTETAAVVPVAKRTGARVVIINAEPTEMDDIADAVLRGSIAELLPPLVGMSTQ